MHLTKIKPFVSLEMYSIGPVKLFQNRERTHRLRLGCTELYKVRGSEKCDALGVYTAQRVRAWSDLRVALWESDILTLCNGTLGGGEP